jgi:hypothetical protein
MCDNEMSFSITFLANICTNIPHSTHMFVINTD